MASKKQTTASQSPDEVASNEVGPVAASVPLEATSVELPQESLPWHLFLRQADDLQIRERFGKDVKAIIDDFDLKDKCVLALLKPEDAIGSFDLDQIYNALLDTNADRSKDVLLIILSRGGQIEPAYQVSKLCKKFAKSKFVVAVPRQAKSAATLIALGADEIHIGPLGQLGPIDPQLGGLPALGVSQALQTIAGLAEQYPKSSEMFARYLRLALTVEQIGYCDRVSASAAQYAERLLSTKGSMAGRVSQIARYLVYEYKDHGFVIDLNEARQILGEDWVVSESIELNLAEKLYGLFDWVNLWLSILDRQMRLLVVGKIDSQGALVVEAPSEKRYA